MAFRNYLGTCILLVAILTVFFPGRFPGGSNRRTTIHKLHTHDDVTRSASSLNSSLVYQKKEFIASVTKEAVKVSGRPTTRSANASNSIDADTYIAKEDFDWKSHVRFFVLGVQKGGTTSLYKYIGQHPKIKRPNPKETQCFQVDYKATDPYCERYFAVSRFWKNNSNADYITGDFSPGYIWKSETTIPRIQAAYPNARFIVSLRRPIDRAYSQYRMLKRNKQIKQNSTTFDSLCMSDLEIIRKSGLLQHWNFPDDSMMNDKSQSLEILQDRYLKASVNATKFANFFQSPEMTKAWKRLLGYKAKNGARGLVQKGLYAIMLQRWLTAFPRERFLILSLQDTARNLQETMRRIHEHLDIPHLPLKDVAPVNTATDDPNTNDDISDKMRQILSKLYQPFDEMLPIVLMDKKWSDPWESSLL